MLEATNLVWAWSWRHEGLLCLFKGRRETSAQSDPSCSRLVPQQMFERGEAKIKKEEPPAPFVTSPVAIMCICQLLLLPAHPQS